VTASGFV